MNKEQHNASVNQLTTLQGLQSVYFIGIGGIGMSALARYFHAKGVKVSGYDRTKTSLTETLQKEGIDIHYSDDVSLIPKDVELVVYTPAVPKDHAGLNYYRDHQFKVVKRSDVLQVISAESFNICIGGTHGKTTITTMVAHILRHSGYGCNAFLGGIAANYGTNFWSSENNVAVIEADEYDRSFLKLSPDVAVITAMDADHLDIYGSEEALQDAFIQFGSSVKENGLLLTRFGLPKAREIKANKKWNYSATNDSATAYASNVQIIEGGYQFDVQLPGAFIGGFRLHIGGMHNVENVVAAITVAHYLQIDEEKIRAAVADFKGVKRRFEYIIGPQEKQEGAYRYPVFIDDYAHHPEELKALLKSARSLFPQRKVTVLFQPHLYSRTKDFKSGFASSLGLADNIILLPIYPARELPVEGVNSEMILNEIDSSEKQILQKEEILTWAEQYSKTIDKEFGEVIITAGAGDIDTLVAPLKTIFEKA